MNSPKKKRKHILFVTESLGRGGMETVLVNISNALVQCGYFVTILCYDSNDVLKSDLDDNVSYIFKPRREFKLMNRIPHIRRYYNYKKAAWEHRVSARSLYGYFVGREHFDVEIGFYRGPSIKIVSGSKNRDSLKMAWVHTDFKLCDKRTIIGWFNSIEEAKGAYEKMNKVVCVSEQARKSFEDVIGCRKKTTTVYNLIPTEKILSKCQESCPVAKSRFTIITVGRLIPDKRQDRLLAATKRLLDEGFSFDVWIVGSGRAEEDLKKYCVENHLDNVSFLGMQDNPYKYLKKADLFVLTSRREGFAIVIPEAMACGLPVVSTKCAGPTEILKDGEYGLLVDNSSEGIYSGIKKMLENPALLEFYQKKSEERYKDFDETIIIKEIIDLFDNT